MCRMHVNRGSLSLLEHSGLAQACAGIVLPLPLPLHLLIVVTVGRGK